MINQILADYYEEKGFINKAKRLRRKSFIVATGNDFHLKEAYLKGNGHYFGYKFGYSVYYAGSNWYGNGSGSGTNFGYKKQIYKTFVPL